MKGVVRKWDDSRGYGFIIDERGRDHFVHYTQILGDGFKSLTTGQQVEFNSYEASKGLEAKDVKKI